MKVLNTTRMVTNILLTCGILSSLLYIGTDIFAAMSWKGYSYTSQTVSEIFAIGAPTRQLWVIMGFLYVSLIFAFGIGVWRVASHNRLLRVAAIMLIAYGVINYTGTFFPMHMRESGSGMTFTDVMHIIVSASLVLSTVLYIGFGAAARGKWFRIYSIVTILSMVIFGTLAFLQAPRIAAGLPTPWLGVFERANIYSSMLWVLVLSVVLVHSQSNVARGCLRNGIIRDLRPQEVINK